MDYELPTEFDLIVLGTGVVESVVSAAASRIGKRVLHIDSNNYYGGPWASFNLDSLQKLGSSEGERNEAAPGFEGLEVSETLLPVGNNLHDLKNFSVEWHIPENNEIKPDPEPEAQDALDEDGDTVTEEDISWSQEGLLKESRKFNIDLTPKLQFARGNFVELLISSNIARYSEYRSVSRVLTWLNGELEVVPCSRSDVFANNKVSVIEKRMLMKLFTSLDSEEKEISELPGYENKTFRDFLREKKLTPNLIHYVLYAIAMGTDRTPCLQGIKNTRRFLDSLGRFGKTPFLFSMYGSGEITQGFCRLSAVFGGIYALNQSPKGLVFENGSFKALACGKQKISAPHLVIEAAKCPITLLKDEQAPKSYISRAVFITNKSVMASEKENLTLLLYPPENGKNSCTIIELGTLTGTCPKGLYVVHMISRQLKSPQEDFQHCKERLFATGDSTKDKPQILWSCYFSIPDTNDVDFLSGAPENVAICPGPDLDLDYDFSVKKAKEIFERIYPDCEFLPRAPDPEEIIIEGCEEADDGAKVEPSPEEKSQEQTNSEGDGDKVQQRERIEDNNQEQNSVVKNEE